MVLNWTQLANSLLLYKPRSKITPRTYGYLIKAAQSMLCYAVLSVMSRGWSATDSTGYGGLPRFDGEAGMRNQRIEMRNREREKR